MSIYLAAVLVLSTLPGEVSESAATSAAAETKTAQVSEFSPRTPAEMRKAVSDALRANASAKDADGREVSIRQLCLLLLELEQDINLVREERVSLHTQIRSRLTRVEKQLSQEIARNAKATKTEKLPSGQEKLVKVPVHAQQLAPMAPLANVPAVDNKNPGLGSDAGLNFANMVKSIIRPDTWDVNGGPGVAVPFGIGQPGVLAQLAPGGFPAGGGAGMMFPQGGALGVRRQFDDHGQALVELIQQVIAPRTWDVNGGPGAVVYYGNLRALVIRAPGDVHGQVGNVLGQLRQ